MERLEISLMTSSEQPDVAAMLVEAYLQFSEQMADAAWTRMREVLESVGQDPSGFNLVARLGPFVAGHITYYPPGAFSQFDIGPRAAFIRLLGVDPAFRGRSIARQLTEEAIRLAWSAEAESIALHTNELMLYAQALYRSMGFRLVRQLPDALGLAYVLYDLKRPNVGPSCK